MENMENVKEKKIIEINKIENKIQEVGIDLNIIDSLLNFLNLAIETDDDCLKQADIANLVIVIKKLVDNTLSKYDKIENVLEI